MLFNPLLSITPKRSKFTAGFLDLIFAICDLPAMSVMVFSRRGLGVRIVSKPSVFLISFTLWFLGWWGVLFGIIRGSVTGSLVHAVNPSLLLFSVAVFIMGVRHNKTAWNELRSGRLRHTYSRGKSRLAALPIPVSGQRLQTTVEPLIVIAGAAVALYGLSSWGLAAWLLWAGLCLAITEELDIFTGRERLLDEMDAMLMGELRSQEVQSLRAAERSLPGEEPQTTREEIGLSPDQETDDLQRQMLRRQRRRQAADDKDEAA